MADLLGWNPEDYAALVALANQMGVHADWLAAVMLSESGMNPNIVNSVGCIGLIQFCGAKPPLGLTPAQQMPYVGRYYGQFSPPGGWYSRAQIYQANFVPATLPHGSDPDLVLARQGDGNYEGNAAAFDVSGKGTITVQDLDDRLDRIIAQNPKTWAAVESGIGAAGGTPWMSSPWVKTAAIVVGGLALGGFSFYVYENRAYLPRLPRMPARSTRARRYA
jgi:hypothetical protein